MTKRLINHGARQRRKGWTEAARLMAKRRHDRLLDKPTATRFDRREWDWSTKRGDSPQATREP